MTIYIDMQTVSLKSVNHSCLTLSEPLNCSPLGSSIHGILQTEYWSGLPFPSSGAHLNPGIEFLHCRQILYQLSHPGNSFFISCLYKRSIPFQIYIFMDNYNSTYENILNFTFCQVQN